MILALLAIQSAALPDIELNARVQARRVTIEKRGDAALTATASPDAGSKVEVRAPAANGRKTLRDVDVRVRAEARIGEGAAAVEVSPAPAATSSPE